MSLFKKLSASLALIAVSLFVGCGPAAVEPELNFTAAPRTLDGAAQKSILTLTATDAKAAPGTGTVRVTSTVGSLKDGVELTLAAGMATGEFTCNRSIDAACSGSVKLTAEWVVGGKLVSVTSSITVTPAVVDAGMDGGVDAGSVDAGIDAGMVSDGGRAIVFTADKTQIIAGVGDPAILSATLVNMGQPVAGEELSFSTTTGSLGPVGGSSVGANFPATTNSAGLAQAQIVAGASSTGSAVVTVRADGGVSAQLTVNIVTVSQIGFISTECPQTTSNCNLMGLQGSGFNETALLKFKVSDGLGAGVSGVRVDFSLINAPAGTSVDPFGTTNAMGEVRANVRAGTTVGTFSVRATALNNMFSVVSPTIGVRGAKASNRGFTMQCNRVNLPAYATVTPPFLLMNTCTVALTDRYGNPVGTGTQVRLNSEAGTVPNNVATNPFTPTGNNEGIGTFTFSTNGVFPALDVPPLTQVAGQYPYPLFAEPTSVVGPLTKNPRDGLVTLIAYLQGEEDFKDDNSNGVRDIGEQFIDQGEPFVDANDNGVWNTGESFIDTPPADGGVANGIWDPPNGVWDSNAQIWTEYRLLYTGPSSTTLSMITNQATRTNGGNYGTVPADTTKIAYIFMPDDNVNRIEGGSGLVARWFPSTRGQLTIINNNVGLDGYGFSLERRLVNPAGNGPCTPSELVCRWKVLFGTWDEGYLGNLQISAGMSPASPSSQGITVESTVRNITVGVGATGVVQ